MIRRNVTKNLRIRLAALVLVPAALVLMASHLPSPDTVVVTGTLQTQLGCSANGDPLCAASGLSYDSADDKWVKRFGLTAGSYSYQVALDGGAATYGSKPLDGTIALNLTADAGVKFYYDHATHWVGDSVTATIATVAGNFQGALGCPGDWQPDCLRSMLTDHDGDRIYTFNTALSPGNKEFKIAHNEAWDESYGQGGGSDNIRATVTDGGQPLTIAYVPGSHQTFLRGSVRPTGGPTMVVFPGSMQSEAGCSGDWDPACPNTALAYDAEDDLWQRTVSLPAGNYEYKAALNGNWDVNYGAFAQRNGGNIGLILPAAGSVKFYYNDKTHFVTSTANDPVAVAVGNFQKLIGCASNDDPTCLRSFLEDTDGDLTLDAVTPPLPPGSYTVSIKLGEGTGATYGAGCAVDGAAIPFTITGTEAKPVYFGWVRGTGCTFVVVGGRPKGGLGTAKAIWLTPEVIAWDTTETPPPAGALISLHHDPTGALAFQPDGIRNGTTMPILFDPAGLPADLKAKYPHLKDLKAFRVMGGSPANIKALLQEQLAVSIVDATRSVDATAMQIGPVLDEVYGAGARGAALGASWNGDVPTLAVWAPTAQDVKLLLFDTATATASTSVTMTRDDATGVWSVTGQPAWKGKYYQYEVRVFTRAGRIVATNRVTDPYSADLSMNSGRTHLVNLADAALKPGGWDALAKPALDAPEDIVLYELHIRDFSASDATVAAAYRGKYLAFTEAASNGMKHLQRLADTGLTHVHLLPAFDIASVNEDASQQRSPTDITGHPADSQNQQAAVGAVKDQDPFNWGYDPLHYGAPEGSYASNPNDGARVLEFRSMVQALSAAKLRVVMDVVYNHTNASGQSSNSVLDRIVPGYYHRLNLNGFVETSTCCENTASERVMMEKLMVDTLVRWARDFKVDGFRFDIMGHHTKQNILNAKTALQALTPGADGVDGSKIYLYGEGWNFGEVENDKQFLQARQLNMAGTGVGTFNDRIRDAVRGGGPFSGLQEQGFATGLYSADNGGGTSGGPGAQRSRLTLYGDHIRVSMAGNLKTVALRDSTGKAITGYDLDYGGQHAGYTEDPSEIINYVSAHDNETIFDAIQFKAARSADMKTRVRMNTLALATVMLGQGVPFFHAGDEILRSKSLDRNSYNSGDWFNVLDWTYQTNNWGVGLPPSQDNSRNWAVMGPLLRDSALRPAPEDIQDALDGFLELLKIRKSSPLFRMRTAGDVNGRVKLWNTGANQVPGLLVMELKNVEGEVNRGDLVVILNGTPAIQHFLDPVFTTRQYALHAVQRDSADATVKTSKFVGETGQFSVPGLTAAVFELTETTGVEALDLDQRCACATGPDMALGGAVLGLAMFLLRRRRSRARA